MFHWSIHRISLSHPKLVQRSSNVLLLREEYNLQMFSYFNTKIVVNIHQVCHFKTLPQFLPYGCNIALIFACHQKIMYIPLNSPMDSLVFCCTQTCDQCLESEGAVSRVEWYGRLVYEGGGLKGHSHAISNNATQ